MCEHSIDFESSNRIDMKLLMDFCVLVIAAKLLFPDIS